MDTNNIDKYLALMGEIKRRTHVIDVVGRQQISTPYRATNIDLIYLQFRKVLELIAFGSLVANEEVYTTRYADFATTWNAKKMLEKLKEVNADFYPKPIVQVPSTAAGIKMDCKEAKVEDYLGEDEFVDLYNKSSGVVHARNPNGTPLNYEAYEVNAPVWQEKIRNLLNSHLIRLVDDPNLYLIQMNVQDQQPTYNSFAPMTTTVPTSS